jgi:hypothetical protein
MGRADLHPLARQSFSRRQTNIDEGGEFNQNAAMKYLSQLTLAIAATFVFAPGAMAAGGAAESETQLGPHSAQKFAMLQHLISRRSIDPSTRASVALVLTVEQKMNGNQQQIVAKAAAHKDGPHGLLASAQGVQVRILEPGPVMASEMRKTPEAGELHVTKTIPAPGGKYKTVVAEATINSPDYPDSKISLTIPGDK